MIVYVRCNGKRQYITLRSIIHRGLYCHYCKAGDSVIVVDAAIIVKEAIVALLDVMIIVK